MFFRDAKSWKYFCAKDKAWKDSGSLDFSSLLKYEIDYQRQGLEEPEDALPAFSGSKILCVGRNYRKHAQELGHDVPSRPLWFTKPPSAIIGNKDSVKLPSGVGRIDYEGELVLIIGKRASKVSLEDAESYIGGVTASFDITARDLQKQDGQWTRAKGFDTFLPLAGIVAPYSNTWKKGMIEVRKNGLTVQKDCFSSMVFDFATLIKDISACMTLEPGDLILTGTPEGVGPVVSGDLLEIEIKNDISIFLKVRCE